MNRHCSGYGALPPFPAGWGGTRAPGAPPPSSYAYAFEAKGVDLPHWRPAGSTESSCDDVIRLVWHNARCCLAPYKSM